MKLYDFPLSGNAYKVRLLLSFLKLSYESQIIDLAAGEQKQPEFLSVNPDGQVPVLVDGSTTLSDSHAILFYLAKKHGSKSNIKWLPEDAAQLGEVVKFISQVSDDVNNGLSATRLVKLFGAPLDYQGALQRAETHLAKLDGQLNGKAFLLGDAPTLADIAMYPYVYTAADGGCDTVKYPAVTAWLSRFEALPGYVALDG